MPLGGDNRKRFRSPLYQNKRSKSSARFIGARHLCRCFGLLWGQAQGPPRTPRAPAERLVVERTAPVVASPAAASRGRAGPGAVRAAQPAARDAGRLPLTKVAKCATILAKMGGCPTPQQSPASVAFARAASQQQACVLARGSDVGRAKVSRPGPVRRTCGEAPHRGQDSRHDPWSTLLFCGRRSTGNCPGLENGS